MSTTETVLLIVGGAGFLFLLASVLIGDFGHGHAEVGSADTGGDTATDPPWFSTQIIAAAMVGFGGTGFLALSFEFPAILAWPAAVAGFFAVAVITRQCVVKPLARQQHNSLLSRQSYVGLRGHVTLPVPSDGFGEVRFPNSNGVVVYERARSTGGTLDRNTAVMIVNITPEGVVVEPDTLHVGNGG